MSTDSPNGGWPGAPWEALDVLVLAPTPTHPIDAGNRRRIYFINLALQRAGARITYVHYPAEGDWRERTPPGSIAAMARQWHEVHTVPVTRSLHDFARGEDHAIDEWWDPAIGDMLSWLFRTHRFQVFIVNYAWLSKAFEFCPPGVLKVLDTHDRFSGRRELLARHGIAPEFFHTTVEEERIALERADVVWSIKPEEAAFFRSITARPVVNMPHSEPLVYGLRARLLGPLVRFGIAGAANSVNERNLRAFLAEAEAYIRRTLLPCEFVIGGSICELLADVSKPWLRLLGRVADMADFYAAVDVVLAPVTFSTGLKIKVGEALCHGKAVVALAHAFEGFPARHPFHTLGTLGEMLRACRRIVNDPRLIDELQSASAEATLAVSRELAEGLAATVAERWRLLPGICIVVGAAELHGGSLVLDHVREVAQYVGHLSRIIVFVAGGAASPDLAALRAVAEDATLVLTPELAAALGREACEALSPAAVHVRTLRDLLREPHEAFWFASAPPAWRPPSRPRAARAYLSCDSVLQSAEASALLQFLGLLRRTFSEVVVLSRRGEPGLTGAALASWGHRVPLMWRGDRSLVLAALRRRQSERVVLLADDIADPLLRLVVELVLKLSSRPLDVVLPDRATPPPDAALAEALAPDAAGRQRLRLLPLGGCFRPNGHDALAEPALVLDLARDPSMDAARELFDLAGVARAELFTGAAGPAHGAWREPAGAAGLFESVLLVERLLTEAGRIHALAERRSYWKSRTNDAGWNWIWAEVKELVGMARA
jgi:hypothetical protein